MQEKSTKLLIAIVLQIVIVFSLIVFKFSVVVGGVDVLLKVAPVDPRDPLRGDYVTFRYDVSNIPAGYIPNKMYPLNSGQTIYVTLTKSYNKYDESFRITGVTDSLPKGYEVGDIPVYIKATVVGRGSNSRGIPVIGSLDTDTIESGSDVRVSYGVEEYFIPEGSGRGVIFFNKDVKALVSVDARGNSVLKQVYIDDEPWP